MPLHLFRMREGRIPLAVAICSVIGLLALGANARAADPSGNAAPARGTAGAAGGTQAQCRNPI